jgi:hypothetical protein
MTSAKRWRFADIQSKVRIAALAVLAIASIETAAFNLPPEWQTPLVLTALLAIILLLSPVEEIHSDVRFLKEAAPPPGGRTRAPGARSAASSRFAPARCASGHSSSSNSRRGCRGTTQASSTGRSRLRR